MPKNFQVNLADGCFVVVVVYYAFIVNNRPLAVRGHVTNGSFKQ